MFWWCSPVTVSISNVVVALWTHPGIKQAWLANGSPFSQTIFYLKYGDLKDTPFWAWDGEQGKGRNTGCLGKEKKYFRNQFAILEFLKDSFKYSAPQRLCLTGCWTVRGGNAAFTLGIFRTMFLRLSTKPSSTKHSSCQNALSWPWVLHTERVQLRVRKYVGWAAWIVLRTSQCYQLPTPVCRQHSTPFILATICLPKKKLQYMHARHKTFNGFTSICAQWTVEEQKPETLPSRERIHPRTSPTPWFVPGLWDKLALGRQSALNSHTWPESLLGELSIFQLHLQDSSDVFRALTSPTRLLAIRLAFASQSKLILQESKERNVSERWCGISLN